MEKYLQGNCDVMAIALHRLTGYPLGLISGINAQDEDDPFLVPGHAVVIVDLPSLRWIDIRGEQRGLPAKENVLVCGDGCSSIVLLPASEESVREAFTMGAISEEEISEAMEVARRNLPLEHIKISNNDASTAFSQGEWKLKVECDATAIHLQNNFSRQEARLDYGAGLKLIAGTQAQINEAIKNAATDMCAPDICEDENDVRYGLCATFGESESHIRYALDGKNHIRLFGLYSDGYVGGREMVKWLNSAYGKKIVVDEVAPTAVGFWELMQEEGRIQRWAHKMLSAATVPMPELVGPVPCAAIRDPLMNAKKEVAECLIKPQAEHLVFASARRFAP